MLRQSPFGPENIGHFAYESDEQCVSQSPNFFSNIATIDEQVYQQYSLLMQAHGEMPSYSKLKNENSFFGVESNSIDQLRSSRQGGHGPTIEPNKEPTKPVTNDESESPTVGTVFDLSCTPLMQSESNTFNYQDVLLTILQPNSMIENKRHSNKAEYKQRVPLQDLTNDNKIKSLESEIDIAIKGAERLGISKESKPIDQSTKKRKERVISMSSPPITANPNSIHPNRESKKADTKPSPKPLPLLAASSPAVGKDAAIQIRKKRFDGDLYTPRWIRGTGSHREGLCELCSPGVWLRTKQSSYWYHLNFYHGISASTGRPYDQPVEIKQMRGSRLDSDGRTYDVITLEGLCGTCARWVVITSRCEDGSSSIVSNVPIDFSSSSYVNFASWYRHAQKCHRKD